MCWRPNGTPIPNTLLDVWETNDDGFYDSQLPEQPEFDLRGKFRTNADGEFKFVCIRPVPYPIPYDGPVGQMLKATQRHPNRPAHIHVIVSANGFTPVTTHIFDKASKWLDSDAVFGTKDSLLVDFVKRTSKKEAAKHTVAAPFCEVNFDFVLNPLKKR